MSDPTIIAPEAPQVEGAQKETHPDFWSHPARATAIIVDKERGVVEVVPKRKKVAIIGFADSSRAAAPFDDPTWECWILNQLYRHTPRFDRHFEIHRRDIFEADTVRDTDYVGWLRTSPVPIYMGQVHADIPQSVRYPIEAVGRMVGMPDEDIRKWLASLAGVGGTDRGKGPYLQSAIAFMIALAVLEGFEEIGLWGIDLVVGAEYEYQKCNAEWWLGIAIGRGIRVTRPETSALMRQLYVYGYEVEPAFWPWKMSDFKQRLAQIMERRNVVLTSLNQIDGAIHEAGNIFKTIIDVPGCPLTLADAEARLAKLYDQRNEFLTEMNALDGAINENEGWLEMMTMVQRGATPVTSWARIAR